MAIDVTTVIKQLASGSIAFDLFFKNFDVGMAVNGFVTSGAFVFHKHILLSMKQFY